MDKKQAQSIIKETFEKPFDKAKFTGFVKNLLNTIQEDTFTYKGNYIPDAYEQYINTLERIGKYSVGEHKIDILIAKLKKETSIERARTMQRNFIAWYLNGSRGGELKDAALVAFVAPNEEDWRFSLVKMDYRFEEGKSGRMRVKEEFTPARRWSFLVGANENSHTAQSQLVDILADDEKCPNLTQLEDAFNIEKVTREFFEKYRELFLWSKETLEEVVKKDKKIKEDFETKGVSAIDFSKKILGQIVFLYFLQKKGWFGVKRDADWGTGPKNFLRELFEGKHGSYKNFFNDILEPLFYEALARERDDDFYSRFNCKIPFLNGGLFDPINNYDWVHTDILLPNELFSNAYKTKEGDKGNGILDIFDRYNFTVKEDEPLEKEVAVDPEMLGKVFENLLDVKDRKSKGTYYTPREIVHYMCKQSLINYLSVELEDKASKNDIETFIHYGESVSENEAQVMSAGRETQTYYHKLPESIRLNAEVIDGKLANIKVCDPAIGSGAFPLGMMSEIVRARNTLSNYIKDDARTIYNFKRDCIHNSLYGVDIDPSAVEIAKLRLWLSLVVDESDIRKIKPLPNLDYKIMQGNSLLEEYEGIKLFDEKIISAVDFDKEKRIEALKAKQAKLSAEYISLHQANKLLGTKRAEIDEELKKITVELKRINRAETPKQENIDLFHRHDEARQAAGTLKKLHKEFFETTQKKKKEELKIRIEKMEWQLIEASLKENGKISELTKLQEVKNVNVKPYFIWKLHFSEVFEENGGFDVVIANPPYINTNEMKEAAGLYKQFYETAFGGFDIYVIFFEKAIGILRHKGTLSFITSNKYFIADYARRLRQFLFNNTKILFLLDLADCRKVFENVLVSPAITILSKEKKDDYEFKLSLLKDDDLGIINNLSYRPMNIKDLTADSNKTFDIYIRDENRGLLNKILDGGNYLCDIAEVRTGVMGFEYWAMEPFIKEGKQNAECIRIVINSHIERYAFLFGKEVNLYKNNFRNPYLNIKRAPINENTKKLFLKEKIIVRGVAKELSAQLDTEGFGVLVAVHAIISKDEIKYMNKFLLSLLNSSYFNWYHLTKFYTARIPKGSLRYPISFLKNIPIKQVTEKEQKPFIEVVDKIVSITKNDDYQDNSGKRIKVNEYKRQIDQMVYKLYDLTKEEIKIVEGSTNGEKGDK